MLAFDECLLKPCFHGIGKKFFKFIWEPWNITRKMWYFSQKGPFTASKQPLRHCYGAHMFYHIPRVLVGDSLHFDYAFTTLSWCSQCVYCAFTVNTAMTACCRSSDISTTLIMHAHGAPIILHCYGDLPVIPQHSNIRMLSKGIYFQNAKSACHGLASCAIP